MYIINNINILSEIFIMVKINPVTFTFKAEADDEEFFYKAFEAIGTWTTEFRSAANNMERAKDRLTVICHNKDDLEEFSSKFLPSLRDYISIAQARNNKQISLNL